MTDSVSYKDSGVDVRKGEIFVEKIKKMVGSTYGDRVCEGVGGFASLYDIGNDKLIAAGTDGVGTKLKIAQLLGIHNTIGIDLVAMCANDIICTGAAPLFFMDYLATGKLDLEVSQSLIEGIVAGCKESGMALIGGETAEMPGMYQHGEYDLAGFAVGEVYKSNLIDGKKVQSGDSIVGVASSGIHSNGFSLVRKLIDDAEKDLLKEALAPTRLYCKMVHQLIIKFPDNIKGLAHITGGGFSNIVRINSNVDYKITDLPGYDEIPAIFNVLKDRSGLDKAELYNTFNMGVGFVVITDKPNDICESMRNLGHKSWVLGEVVQGTGKLIFSETKC